VQSVASNIEHIKEIVAMLRQALAEQRPYALAIVDMRIPPGWDGIETIRQLWAEDPTLQAVICTAYSDYSWNQTVQALGDTDNLVILKKPFDNIEVLHLAHALTQKWAATRAARARMADLDEAVRQRTAELRSSEERFVLAFQASPISSALQNLADRSYLDVNTAFVQLSGYSREDLLQCSPEHLDLWADPAAWAGVFDELRAQHPVLERHLQLRPRRGLSRASVSGFEFGVWHLAFGVWPLAFGLWSLAFGVWSLEFGLWPLAFGLWPLAFGLWSLEFGLWPLAFGLWPLAFGVWPLEFA
jgi:two-component system cell cycle sensor histidine kinase/response regulator CckA